MFVSSTNPGQKCLEPRIQARSRYVTWPGIHRLTVLSVLTAAGGYINSHLPSTVAPIYRPNEALDSCRNEARKNHHKGKLHE